MITCKKKYDIAVVGGGMAGTGAALQASRMGFKTVLIEKTVFPGGLATSGLVYIYLPLCDGKGRQVTFGIAEELLRKSFLYGPGEIPENWQTPENNKSRFRTPFSPASFILAMDEMLENEKVDVWYDTLFCLPVIKDDKILGIETENKSGRILIEADLFIDATGDSDLAFRAGCPCIETDNWLSMWAVMASYEHVKTSLDEHNGFSLFQMKIIGGDNAGRNTPVGKKKYFGTDGRQVTQFTLESRRILKNALLDEEKKAPDSRNRYFPLTLPNIPQFRTTRRIDGLETVADNGYGQPVKNSVGMVADWRKSGYVWEIPYGSLVPKKITNLLAAGRCISSERDAWEVTRVIQAAAFTGQIAGLAGSLALKHNTAAARLDINILQKEITGLGIPLHINQKQ
ncbi:MAG TPA: hypothetical protein DC049_15660 [Spirochaetia bacterium]|nr:hypothetical protein [Spirochaetia bacterium]